MKKYLCLLIACFLVIPALLVSCDREADTGTNQGTDAESTPRYTDLLWDDSWGNQPYQLYFVTNGDGTCSVQGIMINPETDQPFEVVIPEQSPAGDTVVDVMISHRYMHSEKTQISDIQKDLPFAMPLLIPAETFTALCEEMRENGMNDWDYSKFTAYYILMSVKDLDDRAKQEMLDVYPFVAGGDVYVAPVDELVRICEYLQTYSSWDDQKTVECYDEILAMAQRSGMLVQTSLYLLRDLNDDKLSLVHTVKIPKSVKSIGAYAFKMCTGLTSVEISQGVEMIGDSAFYYCDSLTSITIPDRVTSIGNYAFEGCTGLTSITIPDSVKSIGECAFGACTGLTSITIPDSVTSIGVGAFGGCSGLEAIILSDSITKIGEYAFADCYRLTDIYYTGTEQQWADVTIEVNNEDEDPSDNYNYALMNATIHYNYVPEQ